MRYDTLDSWRGICALMVLLSHCQFASHVYVNDLVRHSFLFVDFFFVLSGFVIAINYQDRLLKGYSLTRFMLLRFFRVWPLHLAVLIGFVAAEFILVGSPSVRAFEGREAFTEDHAANAILTNLVLVHSLPGVHEQVTWNVPSWSISVEFYTYLIFAAGVACVARLPFSGKLLVLGSMALVILCPLVIYFLSENRNLFLMTGGGLIRCLFGFAMGVICAALHTRFRDAHFSFFSRRRLATLLEVLAVLLTVIFVARSGYTSANLAAPFVFALVIWVFAPQGGWLSDLLRTPVPMRLGEWSYSVYMVHYLLLMLLYWGNATLEQVHGVSLFTFVDGYNVPDAEVPLEGRWKGDVLVVAMTALSIGAAMLTYKYIEVPGRNYGRRIVGRKVQPAH